MGGRPLGTESLPALLLLAEVSAEVSAGGAGVELVPAEGSCGGVGVELAGVELDVEFVVEPVVEPGEGCVLCGCVV